MASFDPNDSKHVKPIPLTEEEMKYLEADIEEEPTPAPTASDEEAFLKTLQGYAPMMGQRKSFNDGCEHVRPTEAAELKRRLIVEVEDHEMTLRRLDRTREEVAALRAALEKIAKADCPNYVAHPQSVWWIIHVQSIAQEALLAEGEE